MEKKPSKKSTARVIKSRKGIPNPPNSKGRKRTKIEQPEEIQPVKEVIEIPAALIEIREMAKELQEMRDPEAEPGNLSKVEIHAWTVLTNLINLTDSCISAIKAEGLKEMGLDLEDQRLIHSALMVYARASSDLEAEEYEQMVAKVKDLRERLNGLESFEAIASVNPLPGAQGIACIQYEPEPVNYPECENCGAKHGPDQPCFGESEINQSSGVEAEA